MIDDPKKKKTPGFENATASSPQEALANSNWIDWPRKDLSAKPKGPRKATARTHTNPRTGKPVRRRNFWE